MADSVMTKGDSTFSPPHSVPVEVGSPMHVNMEFVSGTISPTSLGARSLLFSSQLTVAGGSPGKYVAPRLRRAVPLASPSTISTKRPLSVGDPLNWRTSPAFRSSDSPESHTSLSPPNCSPPHKVLVAHWAQAASQVATDGDSHIGVIAGGVSVAAATISGSPLEAAQS
ncbi:unnamed protein product [Calypogeia fissa]